jgi:DNA-binding NarL/FixJ family response regulator
VLIADNHKHFRRGLARVVAAHPGLEVVAEADDGTTALELARRLHPHVALIDVRMPGLDGFEVWRLLASDPETHAIRVVLMTAAPVEALGVDGCHDGSLTVLSKDLDRSEFLAAILSALQLT